MNAHDAAHPTVSFDPELTREQSREEFTEGAIKSELEKQKRRKHKRKRKMAKKVAKGVGLGVFAVIGLPFAMVWFFTDITVYIVTCGKHDCRFKQKLRKKP